MGRVIVYIATSLDGYIAGKNDDLSWLEAFNNQNEDHGYGKFIKNVGAVVLGARTYAESLKHPERILYGLPNWVLSAQAMQVPHGADVTFYSGSLADLVSGIRVRTDKDIFVVGGGQVVSSFLKSGLVDELRHFFAPVLLGEGVPLYCGLNQAIPLRLEMSVPYTTGIVELRYVPHP
jgi:dihydrofolate reductase